MRRGYCLNRLSHDPFVRSGLQASRELPVDATIECVLERALLQAGFLAPSNYGDLFKVRFFLLQMASIPLSCL